MIHPVSVTEPFVTNRLVQFGVVVLEGVEHTHDDTVVVVWVQRSETDILQSNLTVQFWEKRGEVLHSQL